MKWIVSGCFLIFTMTAEALPKTFIMQNMLKKLHAATEATNECTNFSGKWQGSCLLQDSIEESEIVLSINQSGCQNIDVDGQTYAIGGTNSSQSHDSRFSSNETTFTNWQNEKRSALHFKFAYWERAVDHFADFQTTVESLFRMDGDQLKIDGSGTIGENPRSVLCTLTKS